MASYAEYNKSQHNLGAGLIDYYMAAGPGREPSRISDQTWGIEQAEMALGGASSYGDNSPYIMAHPAIPWVTG